MSNERIEFRSLRKSDCISITRFDIHNLSGNHILLARAKSLSGVEFSLYQSATHEMHDAD
jgi:hypothetical protein